MRNPPSVRSLPGLICLLLMPVAARAADQGDPEALRQLGAVVKAYRGLANYADHANLTISTTVEGQRRGRSWPMAIRLQRPNRIALDAGDARLISDGTNLVTVVGPTRKYLKVPAPSALSVSTLSEGPVGAMVLGGPGGQAASAVLSLLLAEDPSGNLLEGGARLKPVVEEDLGGKPCSVLVIDPQFGPEVRLFVDRATNLLAVSNSPRTRLGPRTRSRTPPSLAWSSPGTRARSRPSPRTRPLSSPTPRMGSPRWRR